MVGRKMQQLAVMVICVTLLSVGGAAKVRIDQLARISDQLEKDLTQPTEVYLRQVAQQKAAAKARPSSPNPQIKESPASAAPISIADD